MIKRLTIATILVCSTTFAWAQQRASNSLDGMPLKERIYFGGGGTFGSGYNGGYRYTYLAVNPLVGYRVTKPFSMGTSFNYVLVNYPDNGTKATQYGMSPFVQYRVGKLFGYAEYSFISVPNFDNTYRHTYQRFPVGLGFTQPIGAKAAINVMGLYDLKYVRSNTVFASPWILRVFITAGGISM